MVFFNLEKLKAVTLNQFFVDAWSDAEFERKAEILQKTQNYLLGLWVDYVTHAILYGESRSKNNHTDCCLKVKKNQQP